MLKKLIIPFIFVTVCQAYTGNSEYVSRMHNVVDWLGGGIQRLNNAMEYLIPSSRWEWQNSLNPKRGACVLGEYQYCVGGDAYTSDFSYHTWQTALDAKLLLLAGYGLVALLAFQGGCALTKMCSQSQYLAELMAPLPEPCNEAEKLGAEKTAEQEAQRLRAEQEARVRAEKTEKTSAVLEACNEAEKLGAEKTAEQEAQRLRAEQEAERVRAEKTEKTSAVRQEIQEVIRGDLTSRQEIADVIRSDIKKNQWLATASLGSLLYGLLFFL